MPSIHIDHWGGIRHKRGPYNGPDWIYGYRVPTVWYQSGIAQSQLLPPDQVPRPSMLGVTSKYAYQVTSDCLRADMPMFALADFLHRITTDSGLPRKTIPLKRVFEGGKGGRTFKCWIVGADEAPELAMYYSGSTAIYIKPIAGSSIVQPPKGGKGKAKDETKGKGRPPSRAASRRRSRPPAPAPGTTVPPIRTLPRVNLNTDLDNVEDVRGRERDASPEHYSRRHSPAGWRTPREETPPGSAAAALGFTADTHAVAKATSIDVAAPAVAKPVAPAAVTTVVAPAARVHTNEELREQLAELTRGQLALQTQMQAQQSQLSGLLSTLNTIIFHRCRVTHRYLQAGQRPQKQLPKQHQS